MTYAQGAVLGLVQGVTEFLPISSSGHLILVPYVLGWPEPGLAFDAVMHLGTLAAAAGRSGLAGMRRFGLLLPAATVPGGAGGLKALHVLRAGLPAAERGPLALALLAAFVAGWAAVWFLVGYLRRRSLVPFVVYRVALGLVLLALVIR